MMRVEDELEIRNLVARVAWATDMWRSIEEYTSNYAANGTWEIENVTPVYRGHDGLARRIQEMLEQGICGPGLPARHCITSLQIIFDPADPDTAKAISVAIMANSSEGQSSIGVYGDYEDTVRRVDGKWLMAKRVIRVP